MDIKSTLDYLYSLHTRGIKLGLDRITSFLCEINNPENNFKSVHIAGTNGKGTVGKLVYSVLRASGKRIGLYSSPHLLKFNERIVVNDIEITDQEICTFTDEYRLLFDKHQLTFFEITTAMAFKHFANNNVEMAILETGMGGRLDATNIVVPVVSAITDISMDHENFLGKTIKEIAFEKAGIIKKGIPVVFGITDPEAKQVVEEHALKVADYRDVLESYEFQVKEETAHDMVISIRTEKVNLENIYLPLSGRHQVNNAMIALGVLEQLNIDVTEEHIRDGFKNVNIKGRIEFHKGSPDVVMDVAHNPRKISALNDYLLRFFPKKKTIIVFGVMADKDADQMISILKRDKCEFIFTQPRTDRAMDPNKLIETVGFGKVIPDVITAVKTAKEMAGKRGLVVVTGSFFTVGEAMGV